MKNNSTLLFLCLTFLFVFSLFSGVAEARKHKIQTPFGLSSSHHQKGAATIPKHPLQQQPLPPHKEEHPGRRPSKSFSEAQNAIPIPLNKTITGTTPFGGTLYSISSSYVLTAQTVLLVNITCSNCDGEYIYVYYTSSLTSTVDSYCYSSYENCVIPVTCLGAVPGQQLNWYFLVEGYSLNAGYEYSLTITATEVQSTSVTLKSDKGAFKLSSEKWGTWVSNGLRYSIQYVSLSNISQYINGSNSLLLSTNDASSYYSFGLKAATPAFGPFYNSFGYYCPGQYSFFYTDNTNSLASVPLSSSTNSDWWLAVWTAYSPSDDLLFYYEIISPSTSAVVQLDGKIHQLSVKNKLPHYSFFSVAINSLSQLPNTYYLLSLSTTAEYTYVDQITNGSLISVASVASTTHAVTTVELYPALTALDVPSPLWQNFTVFPYLTYYGTLNVSASPLPITPSIHISSNQSHFAVNTSSPIIYLNVTTSDAYTVNICSQDGKFGTGYNTIVEALPCSSNITYFCSYCYFEGYEKCCHMRLDAESCYCNPGQTQQIMLRGYLFNENKPHNFTASVHNN